MHVRLPIRGNTHKALRVQKRNTSLHGYDKHQFAQSHKVCCIEGAYGGRHNKTRQLFVLFSDVTKVKWHVYLKCTGWQNDMHQSETNVHGRQQRPFHNAQTTNHTVKYVYQFWSNQYTDTASLCLLTRQQRNIEHYKCVQKNRIMKTKLEKPTEHNMKCYKLQAANTVFQHNSTQHILKH